MDFFFPDDTGIFQEFPRLNALMEVFAGERFTILGFPCNQFGLQSPEKNDETLAVLRWVRPGGGFIPKFPIFSKIEVNGLKEEPLYSYLKESLSSINPVIGDIKKLYWSPLKVSDIRWNFEKFLIRADGRPYRRYDLKYPFEEVQRDVAELLSIPLMSLSTDLGADS